MSQAPLLQLSNVALTFGGDPVLGGASCIVNQGDRIALVGRNGSGKSTLLKIMAGLVEPDSGDRLLRPGNSVGYMQQDPDLSGFPTLGDFATSGLDLGQDYLADMAADGVKIDLSRDTSTASGGERRRAALVKILAEAPDLMLLDEPTNHLDIEAIAWLERMLREAKTGYVLISHDRAFLTALTRATLWVDRGVVQRQDKGFADFEAWRDKTWEEEDLARHKLNRKIKAEARWAVEGISARRKRNMGRVRALHALKEERAGQRMRAKTAAFELDSGTKTSKKVIEARDLTLDFGNGPVVKDFSLRVLRGDRIALVGPNGTGKTSLIKMLLGDQKPDQGSMKFATNIEAAYFDQNRAQLDPDRSLWDTLAHDPDMAVAGQNDHINVRGAPKHVVGYLKDFLFTDEQVRAPVRALSGGEKARLLLARLMARQSNVLVLDEPTNDLDIETLDLLQEILSDYDGTVIFVSHDRDFIDRVAQKTLVFEGRGRITAYAGGYYDYLSQRKVDAKKEDTPKTQPAAKPKAAVAEKPKGQGLSFTEKHRLEQLPAEMERLEAEIAKLQDFLSNPDLFHNERLKFDKATEALSGRQAQLAQAEEDWLTLEEKAESA